MPGQSGHNCEGDDEPGHSIIALHCYSTQNNQPDLNSIQKTKEQTALCGTPRLVWSMSIKKWPKSRYRNTLWRQFFPTPNALFVELESLWDDIQGLFKGITLSRRFVKILSSCSRLGRRFMHIRSLWVTMGNLHELSWKFLMLKMRLDDFLLLVRAWHFIVIWNK